MLNHVGRIKKNQSKVVVAYKTVPGEPDNCLVIKTENLMGDEHDPLMRLVESQSGQNAFDLAEAMSRTTLPNGENMLHGFHRAGRIIKMPTNEIEMVPERNRVLRLDELNEAIAQNYGVNVEDLVPQPNDPNEKEDSASNSTSTSKTTQEEPEVVSEEYLTESSENVKNEEVLTDEKLASQYRSEADRLYKEAKWYRDEAERLDPKKKKSQSEQKEQG